MEIIWSRSAKKQLLNIDGRYRERIKQKLYDIGDIMTPPPDLKKLSGPENHYRLRVGDYRIILTHPEGSERCTVVAVKRRNSTTYLHEEPVRYDSTVY